MNEATKQFFVKYYLEQAHSEDFIDWAIACFEDRLDSKNLRILSAMDKSAYKYEVEERFRRALTELDIVFPNRKETLENHVKDLANLIVNEELTPVEGCHRIYNTMVFLDYPKELYRWVYLDEGLEPETYETLYDPFSSKPSGTIERWSEVIIKEAKTLINIEFS